MSLYLLIFVCLQQQHLLLLRCMLALLSIGFVLLLFGSVGVLLTIFMLLTVELLLAILPV